MQELNHNDKERKSEDMKSIMQLSREAPQKAKEQAQETEMNMGM